MAFPVNPLNGQTTILNNIVYVYNIINNTWNKNLGIVNTTKVGLKATDLTVIGSTALNAISANGTLGVSGQVLTSNGSDTFWAPARDFDLVPLRNEVSDASTLDVTTLFNSLLQR